MILAVFSLIFDMVLFDGAASELKVGWTIATQFTKVVFTHGTEYLGSLFLVHVFKESHFQHMKTFLDYEFALIIDFGFLLNLTIIWFELSLWLMDISSICLSDSMFKECSKEHNNQFCQDFRVSDGWGNHSWTKHPST